MRTKLCWLLLPNVAAVGLWQVVQLLHENFYDSLWFIDLGAVWFFGLPLLEAGSVSAALFPLKGKTLLVWLSIVVALMVTAALETWNFFATDDVCGSPGAPEGYCDAMVLHVFVNVPFLFLAAVLILFRMRKNEEKTLLDRSCDLGRNRFVVCRGDRRKRRTRSHDI